MSRRASRSSELGELGSELLGVLGTVGAGTEQKGLTNQSIFLGRLQQARASGKLLAAYSLLACDVVLQVPMDRRTILWFAEKALQPLPPAQGQMYLGKNKDKKPTFPSKAAGPAERKANIRFGDVWADLKQNRPEDSHQWQLLSGNLRGLTDDQAACALLAGEALRDVPGHVELALRLVLDPEGAKALSSVLKSLGANGTELGSRLCEANTLRGRGAGGLDLRAKARERTAPAGTAGPLARVPADLLRAAVREVYREELPRGAVEFDTPAEFWSKRWLWCVNGGHSRMVQKADDRWTVNHKGRVHRRVAMEEWVDNPLEFWDGEVHVSASVKQEHGKDRMILACDTISYVAFEHLVRPAEGQWRNKRVVLDPGKLGHSGMAERVRQLGRDRDLHVMLDYDDFNSQHSLEAQKIVVEELVAHTGYDKALGQRLVDSFDRMWVYEGGDRLGRATATLMSGHRCTTLINSVLNAAYLRVAMGRLYKGVSILHAGDDVVASMGMLADVTTVLGNCERYGLRMNPLKQSIGREGSEFLRVAIRPDAATGYVMRSIASAVSGSWVNPNSLEAGEAIRTMLSNSRSLINRSRKPSIARLLVTSFSRRAACQKALALSLLSGKTSLGYGPCFSSGRRYRSANLVSTDSYREVFLRGTVASEATDAYLGEHVSDVEVYALDASGSSPTEAMLDSSYGKTLTGGEEVTTLDVRRIAREETRTARGIEDDISIARRAVTPGLLTRFPLLHLIKHRLVGEVLKDVLHLAGWDGRGEPRVEAWGSEGTGAIVEGVLSYSDAAYLCKKTTAGVIKVTKPVYV